ncbi:Uncharacterised protein [Chlamydia trachomatis]|nr:Uncharacterised protein [Chlamydia trachomatis]
MAKDHVSWHRECQANTTHLILKEMLQWLHQLEVHTLRQSAHVVVALDHFARDIDGLDDIRINGSLSQPTSLRQLLRLSLKDLDEVPADHFALSLGITDACQIIKELRTRVNLDTA